MFKKDTCVPIGRLLRALIIKTVYSDDGPKLDKQMYRDLFGETNEVILKEKINTGKVSPSGISILDIYKDPEYQYFNSKVSPLSFGYMRTLIGVDKGDSDIVKDSSELNNISNNINVETSMTKFGNKIYGKKPSKDGREKRQYVAYFFNIALIIYSLYYRENDIIPQIKGPPKINEAKQNISLAKIFKTTVKPFIKDLNLSPYLVPFIPYSNKTDKEDAKIKLRNTEIENENIQIFIRYYKSSNQDTDKDINSTVRLNSLGSVGGGGRRKTQHKKYKYNKTQKHKVRKYSKTKKNSEKKYTRKHK